MPLPEQQDKERHCENAQTELPSKGSQGLSKFEVAGVVAFGVFRSVGGNYDAGDACEEDLAAVSVSKRVGCACGKVAHREVAHRQGRRRRLKGFWICICGCYA